VKLLQKSNERRFATFLRLMTESLSVIHYYRVIYSHMTGICAIHFRLYTMTEIRNEGNPKFLSTVKCIFYGWWKTVPNNRYTCKQGPNRHLYHYDILIFHASFFMIKIISNENMTTWKYDAHGRVKPLTQHIPLTPGQWLHMISFLLRKRKVRTLTFYYVY